MSLLTRRAMFAASEEAADGGGGDDGGVALLASFDLASASASEDLPIATTSRDLLIVASIRSNNPSAWTDLLALQFGTSGTVDTGVSYSYRVETPGLASDATQAGSEMGVARVPATNVNASVFGAVELEVADYGASGQYKSCLGRFGEYTGNSVNPWGRSRGVWRSTDPIDIVRVTTNTGSMVAGSTLNIYGIG